MKRNKRGQMFYACSNWPKCNFASSYKPTGKNCPKCNKPLVETKIKNPRSAQNLVSRSTQNKIKCSNRNCDYEIPKTENNSKS